MRSRLFESAEAGALSVVIAAVLGITVAYLPWRAQWLWREVRNAAATERSQRDLRSASSVGIDHPRVFAMAERVVPRDATFYVATGDGVPGEQASVLPSVRMFASYFLLPRRRAPTAARADWIISYGATLGELPIRSASTRRVAPGVVVARAGHHSSR